MRFLWPGRFLYFDKLSSHRLGGAKIDIFSLLQGGKEFFFVKMLAGWGNVCIFAVREPAKPLCNA